MNCIFYSKIHTMKLHLPENHLEVGLDDYLIAAHAIKAGVLLLPSGESSLTLRDSTGSLAYSLDLTGSSSREQQLTGLRPLHALLGRLVSFQAFLTGLVDNELDGLLIGKRATPEDWLRAQPPIPGVDMMHYIAVDQLTFGQVASDVCISGLQSIVGNTQKYSPGLAADARAALGQLN
jgi:hypothetical protein